MRIGWDRKLIPRKGGRPKKENEATESLNRQKRINIFIQVFGIFARDVDRRKKNVFTHVNENRPRDKGDR